MSCSDQDTPIADLKERVAAFARERDWEQFHTLKNLSVALAGEAAELMEPFQWLEGSQCESLMRDGEKREAVEDELADVAIYALQFANRAGIDLAKAIDRKMLKNARKYPVILAKGSSEKRG
ncbi:nucleotide pyrophosphohydrolase [Pelagicoccus sp. SDUM812005]|uniref:nucleotide pyrophosphohydrolase n=1 Tax=Pelagicoccus sp. SDUM812005 TaxID=3041257 RepID=UPI00280D508C|nr:nucleotide pyrophosphohydrolase [Pelagicoccus sp. SDUM812005]MDQ8183192.1 nucleotide pyrophosphohydrolase [Pelagicoccus sp. SDUM812005]